MERARYEAERAERQYRAVEPENRLVARGLETEWEKRLRDLAAAEAELVRREQRRPCALNQEEKNRLRSLGSDLHKVWTAPTTTDRDRKELLRTLLEEVIVTVNRAQYHAHLTLRWRGGTLTELDLSLPRSQPRGIRTGEDIISLLPFSIVKDAKPPPANASLPIKSAACAAIETFLDSSRRRNHPPGNWRRFAKQRRSWVSTLPLFIDG